MTKGLHDEISQPEPIKQEAEQKQTTAQWQRFYRDQRLREESIRRCREIAEKARSDVKATR